MRSGTAWWRAELKLACACLLGALVFSMSAHASAASVSGSEMQIANAPAIPFQTWVTARWSARPIDAGRLAFIEGRLTALRYPPGFARLYRMEVEVEQDGVAYFLPIQEQLLRAYFDEVDAGRRVRLKLQPMGVFLGQPVLGVSGFQVDSGQTMLLALQTPGVSGWFELQPESRWSPDATILAAMKRDIQAAASASVSPRLASDVSGYFVQYFAQGKPNEGRVTLFGACDLSPSDKSARDPQHLLYASRDGGACFFVTSYDAKRKRFAAFRFNWSA